MVSGSLEPVCAISNVTLSFSPPSSFSSSSSSSAPSPSGMENHYQDAAASTSFDSDLSLDGTLDLDMSHFSPSLSPAAGPISRAQSGASTASASSGGGDVNITGNGSGSRATKHGSRLQGGVSIGGILSKSSRVDSSSPSFTSLSSSSPASVSAAATTATAILASASRSWTSDLLTLKTQVRNIGVCCIYACICVHLYICTFVHLSHLSHFSYLSIVFSPELHARRDHRNEYAYAGGGDSRGKRHLHSVLGSAGMWIRCYNKYYVHVFTFSDM